MGDEYDEDSTEETTTASEPFISHAFKAKTLAKKSAYALGYALGKEARMPFPVHPPTGFPPPTYKDIPATPQFKPGQLGASLGKSTTGKIPLSRPEKLKPGKKPGKATDLIVPAV